MRDMREGINGAIELQEEDSRMHGGTELTERDKAMIEHGYIQCALQVGSDIGMKSESFISGLQEMVIENAGIEEQNSRNQIYVICEKIHNITDEEIKEIEEICQEQISYIHPFKLETARKQHKLGAYNKKVLDSILRLKKIIAKGEL